MRFFTSRRYLRWYDGLPEEMRRDAYKLALFVTEHCEQRVINEILPAAVDKVHKEARAVARRTGAQSAFTKLQLFQLGILEAASESTPTQPLTPLQGWIRYISDLAQYTLHEGSFSPVIGLVGLLGGGQAAECVTLYNRLDPAVAGVPTGRRKAAHEGTAAWDNLKKKMSMRHQPYFRTQGESLELHPTPKCPEDDIYRIFQCLQLWETEHVPDGYGGYCHLIDTCSPETRRGVVQLARVHVSLDQAQCLEKIQDWESLLSNIARGAWHLPQLLAPTTTSDHPGSPSDMPPWHEINERIREKIDWKQQKEYEKQLNRKSPHRQAVAFEILVDGERQSTGLTWHARSTDTISLPAFAHYVEVRDSRNKAAVAHCHLLDPDELPPQGWKSTVKLLSGATIHFALFPESREGEESPGLAMRVQFQPAPMPSRAEVTESLHAGGRRLAEFVRSRWREAGVTARLLKSRLCAVAGRAGPAAGFEEAGAEQVGDEPDVKAYHEALREGVFAPEPIHQPAGADVVRPPDRSVVQPPIRSLAAFIDSRLDMAAASRDRLERWRSPRWQPALTGVSRDANAPSAHEQIFHLDEGSIRVTCQWWAATRRKPASLWLAWSADLTQPGDFWVRFTRHDDPSAVLAERRLGGTFSGEVSWFADELGFDPTREPWALTLVLRELPA